MNKILLAVDGSPSAQRATQQLIANLQSYKEAPELHVLTVHRPIPNIGAGSLVVSKEMVDKYYNEECEAALGPCVKLLRSAGMAFKEHRVVGEIAQSIVNTANELGCGSIVMGTRGHTAVTNLVLGSVAVKVLHVAKVPVTLVH